MSRKISRLRRTKDYRNRPRLLTLISNHLRNIINYFTLYNHHNSLHINCLKVFLSNLFPSSISRNKLLRNKHTGKYNLNTPCRHKIGNKRPLPNRSVIPRTPFLQRPNTRHNLSLYL